MVTVGMLLTGLADTEENVWKMNDAQYSGLSPQSVVAVVQRNYKNMHFLLNHDHAKVLLRASVMHLWNGRSTPRYDVAGLEAGHAVINHLNVSIYL